MELQGSLNSYNQSIYFIFSLSSSPTILFTSPSPAFSLLLSSHGELAAIFFFMFPPLFLKMVYNGIQAMGFSHKPENMACSNFMTQEMRGYLYDTSKNVPKEYSIYHVLVQEPIRKPSSWPYHNWLNLA